MLQRIRELEDRIDLQKRQIKEIEEKVQAQISLAILSVISKASVLKYLTGFTVVFKLSDCLTFGHVTVALQWNGKWMLNGC